MDTQRSETNGNVATPRIDVQSRAFHERSAFQLKLLGLVDEWDGQMQILETLQYELESQDDLIRESRGRLIAAYEKETQCLEGAIEELVRGSEEIRHEAELMLSVPGVRIVSVAGIYATLGSLKEFTRQQASALSGVCPAGERRPRSRRGIDLIRVLLERDVDEAIRSIPTMAEFYKRMLEKPNGCIMSAKNACIRKLFLILHALVLNDTKFEPDHRCERVIPVGGVDS